MIPALLYIGYKAIIYGKSRKKSIRKGISGGIGKEIVVKQHDYGIVVSKCP